MILLVNYNVERIQRENPNFSGVKTKARTKKAIVIMTPIMENINAIVFFLLTPSFCLVLIDIGSVTKENAKKIGIARLKIENIIEILESVLGL